MNRAETNRETNLGLLQLSDAAEDSMWLRGAGCIVRLFSNANQARTSCADGSTTSWVIPVTRPTIVASAG